MAFKTGDLCTLICGSPRMAVEAVDNDGVHVVWCNEGVIHRDTFAAPLLRAWEHREDDRGTGGGKPFKGDRDGVGKRFDKGGRDGGGKRFDDKGKPGWDGKPRQKTHFRKD